MKPQRFAAITERYSRLKIAVVGDYFLDRYLHIDPAKAETSIETGLPVYNVVEVRSQPGAAGTIVNNLVALGIGQIHAVGFCGDDGEGYELRQALSQCSGVSLEHFLTTPFRRTPVYCKPMVIESGCPPRELNRFDSKNWSPTPAELGAKLVEHLLAAIEQVDALILLDQVDLAGTGVATELLKRALSAALEADRLVVTLADSRQGLRDFPPMGFKMNAAELARMAGTPVVGIDAVRQHAADLALRNRAPVFVTLAEQGVVGADPRGRTEYVPAHPVRGPIDVVGAGDAVTANLTAALAAGAHQQEAMELAMAAASVVVHQLGTTGTASIEQLAALGITP
jgi:rfaE bifunctional protein kinase chain/domain